MIKLKVCINQNFDKTERLSFWYKWVSDDYYHWK